MSATNNGKIFPGPGYAGDRWGIFDSLDKVWIGNEKGPILFTTRNVAVIASAVANERLGKDVDRLVPKEFVEKHVRLKDRITPRLPMFRTIVELKVVHE